MAKNVQVILAFALVLAFAPSAFAVIISYGTYGPSDANLYANSASGDSATASDSTYATVTDATAILSDGSTVAASLIELRNATGANARMVAANWFVDVSTISGNYSIMVLPTSQPSTFRVIPYINSTDVSTNTSTWSGPFTVTSNTFQQYDVTNAVVESGRNLGYVRLRFYGVSTTAENFAEIYLMIPPSPTDFQIIPQGVTQAEVDTWVETEWALFSTSARNISASSMSCEGSAMNGTVVVNSSYFEYILDEDESGRHAASRWYANSSIFNEGENYEVLCMIELSNGVMIENVEQYVYINPHKTIMVRIAEFVVAVGKIIGLQRNPVQVRPITQYVEDSATTNVVVAVVNGQNPITGNSSLCTLTVVDSAGSAVINNQSMSVFGSAALGMFNYTMSSTAGAGGPYMVRSTCAVNDSYGAFNNYVGIGTLNPKPISFAGFPSVEVLQGTGISGSNTLVVARTSMGSSPANTTCQLTVYNVANSTKLLDAVSMSAFDSGMYSYTWSSPVSYQMEKYPATVRCTGDNFGSLVVTDAFSLEIDGGVVMRSIT